MAKQTPGNLQAYAVFTIQMSVFLRKHDIYSLCLSAVQSICIVFKDMTMEKWTGIAFARVIVFVAEICFE